ncbi:MAG: AAA family ATPase [Lachnospiraceae bacterium]|nr:AAA family ATPase [Lachnospiraceae bacterium]
MNIADVKQHIIHSVRAYLQRDAEGNPVIPVEKQRPILLMGPPGIGKTAIMEQIAQELGINLVSYTITHHTRQSAIGLPFIVKRNYGGKEYSVTEYTMSEIIASLYDRIELTGVKEGILFLDEINCVSETLSPTMLQFLQYKTFGTHRVPEGFLIVAAGNPPEYNASVRDFDIVTLDRVRVMDVDASYEAWKSYALSAGMHAAVLAYLEIRKEHFYDLRVEPEGKRFVTARGWEDLSRVLQTHEALSLPVGKDLVRQFLQSDEIAEAFATYYELWLKYRDIYRVQEILAGKAPEEAQKEALRKAPFDEKLSLITMLTERLTQSFGTFCRSLFVQEQLREVLLTLREMADEGEEDLTEAVQSIAESMRENLRRKERAGFLSREDAATAREVAKALSEAAPVAGRGSGAEAFAPLKDWFAAREEQRLEQAQETDAQLTQAFAFLSGVFGEGQEIVLFLQQLSAGDKSLKFLHEYGNEAYFRYNRLLLLDESRSRLQEEIRALSLDG